MITLISPVLNFNHARQLLIQDWQNWISTLQRNLTLQSSKKDHEFNSSPYKLRKIDVQSVDWFGGGKKLGFVKLTAEISNDNGESLPGSVFLRGPSVGMMV